MYDLFGKFFGKFYYDFGWFGGCVDVFCLLGECFVYFLMFIVEKVWVVIVYEI